MIHLFSVRKRAGRTRPALLPTLGLAAVLGIASGCVSKSKAQAEARAAYIAGQQQGMMMRSMQAATGQSVTIVGPVNNGSVKWRHDLTLAKAIVEAGYNSQTDPQQIMIVRNGQAVPVDPKQLLSGTDVPLLAGDMIILQQ
jgi:hypothetical protein